MSPKARLAVAVALLQALAVVVAAGVYGPTGAVAYIIVLSASVANVWLLTWAMSRKSKKDGATR